MTPALRLAHQRVCEAAILLASGAAAELVAEALLRALDELEEVARTLDAGGTPSEVQLSS